MRSYVRERLSLCRRAGSKPDGKVSTVSLTSFLIEELRGLEIAIAFRDVATVIEGERITGVQRVSLHEIALGGGPIVFVFRKYSLLAKQCGSRLLRTASLCPLFEPRHIGRGHFAHRLSLPRSILTDGDNFVRARVGSGGVIFHRATEISDRFIGCAEIIERKWVVGIE